MDHTPRRDIARDHAISDHTGQSHTGQDHAAMVSDFRRRFWISLALTIPVITLSPMIHRLLGVREALFFPGSDYILFILATVIYLYGGKPFLQGLRREIAHRLTDSGETEGIPVAALAPGNLVLVKPGEKIPIDGIIVKGISSFNESMLTGDRAAVAKTVAGALKLDGYFAEALPDQKAAKLRGIKSRGLTVAMVGDGVNDAPALVESDLGVAVGAGTEVAIESARMVPVRNDPRDVVSILSLSRATYRKMVQNLLCATGYDAFAISLAAGVAAPRGFVLSPALGAALMSLSTVIVAIDAKLLERIPIRATPAGAPTHA